MMKENTRDYMKQHHMTAPGDGVVAGLSGGADSVCLLHLLWCLKEELGFKLRAVHVHHGLRGEEADRDASFSAEFCRRFQIPFREVRIDAAAEARAAGISVEEAGRQARYRILEEEAVCWEKEEMISVHIAAAHHGDDNAETILHHLFRGSGLKGLSGIAPVRGRMIRPLLWTGREEILCYLKEKHLQWMEDSTNRENEYTRNRIRNKLIPLITAEINPQAVQNILRAGERIGQADRYFEAQAETWLSEYGCYGGDGEETPREYRLDSAALEVQEDILKGYIIRRALTKLSCPLKDITARHLEDVVSLAGKETGKQVMLPRGIRAEKEYGILRIQAEPAPARPEGERTEEDPLFPLKTRIFPCGNPGQFPKNQYTKWFDYDKIKGTMSVRTRRTGDYITLSGGGTKTVKSYMIDEKIPREARDRILLLAEESHILWIVGHRISEYYKVTEHTKTVLEVQFDGGNGNGR